MYKTNETIPIKPSAMKQKIEGGKEITVAQQITASGVGSVITTLLVTPLDVVKTRMQSQLKSSARASTSAYNGTLEGIIRISRTEGVLTLWSGLTATMLTAVPSTVFYFTMYENLKYFMELRYKESMLIPFIAGANARVLAATLVSPMELIRTKMQSEKHSFQDIKNAIQSSIRKDGYQVLWRGVVPTLWRDVLFSAYYWALYEQLKKLYFKNFHIKEATMTQSFICGAISGSIAAVLVTPFDVVKTYRQISIGDQKSSSKKRLTSTWEILKCIKQKNGCAGLFAGVTPRIARIALSAAIMICIYEYMKQVLVNK